MPQRIVPVLVYADVAAARDFLVEAFGFTARPRAAQGPLEVALDGEVVRLVTADPDLDLASVAELGAASDTLHVVVDDVDEHHDRCVAAGAVVMSPLSDQPSGAREYTAADSEGRLWTFASTS